MRTNDHDNCVLGFSGGSGDVVFNSLPRQHTLTVRMDTPEAWNVQSSKGRVRGGGEQQDSDNLKCDKAKCGDDPAGAQPELTEVAYSLKSLLIAGQVTG